MGDVTVKNSGKKGKGVFACRSFKKDEIILKMDTRDVFPNKDMDHMSQYALSHAYTLGKGKNFRMKSPEKYINHSCNPNAFDKQGVVRAMRNIIKGEEITYDYSVNSAENWWMKCRCGHKQCRKTITGHFSKLPPGVRKKYIPYLEVWYKKKFSKDVKKWKS